MADIAQSESNDELPDDVVEAYVFYSTMVDKGIDQSTARRITCNRFPRCEEGLRPMWNMDDQLRRDVTTPSPEESKRPEEGKPASTIPVATGFAPICKIGEGGQAEVWLARDIKLDRFVAIKVIKGTLRESQRTQQRFRREVEITGKLEHPSIVPVYETGSDTHQAGEQPYYVMRLFINRHLLRAIVALHDRPESDANKRLLNALFAFHGNRSDERRQTLVDELNSFDFDNSQSSDVDLRSSIDKFLADVRSGSGGNLHEAIEAHFAIGRPALGFRDLLGRFVDVCHAMAYAHSRGVIHRDLKPRNVMLGEFGETLVVDWGLAKIVGREAERREVDSTGTVILSPDDSEGDSETRVGTVTGTLQYMSPEQAWGRVGELRPASDIYSLGAILFTILTGKPPRQEFTLDAAREGKIDAPSDVQTHVPRSLEKVCLKALSKDPANRYATVEELANDVRNWLADEPVTAWKEPVFRRVRRWIIRHRVLVGSLAAAMLMAAVTLLITVPKLLATAFENEQLKGQNSAMDSEIANGIRENRRAALFVKIHSAVTEGLQSLEDKEYLDAIDHFEPGILDAYSEWRANPDNPEIANVLMQLLWYHAQTCEMVGQHQEAIRSYRRGIEVCTVGLGALPHTPLDRDKTSPPTSPQGVECFHASYQVLQRTQLAAPNPADGVDTMDAALYTLAVGTFLMGHIEPTLLVWEADTKAEVNDIRRLADLYYRLGRLELAHDKGDVAQETLSRHMALTTMLLAVDLGPTADISVIPLKDDAVVDIDAPTTH